MQNFVPSFVEQKRAANETQGSFNASVLFADVSGFTALTEMAFRLGDAGAELMSKELTRIFDPMVEAVHSRGGMIVGFAGDAMTAVFEATGDEARRAYDAGQEIIQFFNENPTSETRHGTLSFGVKCGMDVGSVEWGLPQFPELNATTWYFRGAPIDGAAAKESEAASGEFKLTDAARTSVESQEASGSVETTTSVHDTETLERFFRNQIIRTGDRAELRHATSLFLNFEGIKGHDDIESVYRACVNGCQRHAGVLNKLMFGDKGFTALVLFGAPTATEHAATAAVNFVHALRTTGLASLSHVSVRAGIDSGLVYSGLLGGNARNEWTCIGDSTNTSARLMAEAETGHTMVSPNVAQEAERRWEFKSLGEVHLKGKESAIEAFEPKARRGQMRGFAYRNPMLGRDQELRDLVQHVDPIFADEPEFVGVIRYLGEPGLGKTRLVAALRARLEELDRPFHWVHMPSDGVHKSGWNAVATWLRGFFGVTDASSQPERRNAIESKYQGLIDDDRVPETTRDELKRTMSFAADLVDCHWESSAFDSLEDPKLRHENRIIAVKELIRALAATAPVIIEAEDTHWIDASSAAWLTAMTRNVSTLALAIVSTSRYDDDEKIPELELGRDCPLLDIELKPIEGEEFTRDMARVLLNTEAEMDSEAVRLITGKAKGNPFFTEQLILHLHETGELETVGGEKSADTGTKRRTRLRMKSTDTARLPGSLSSLVTARIDRLSPDVRETVKHASILGVRFLSRVLGELLKRSGKVNRSLDELLLESEKEGVLIPADDNTSDE